MRSFLLGLTLLAAALPVGLPEAGACGDKFLVIGRGVRSQRAHGAFRRASILVYLDAEGRLREALRELQIETNLKLAGHKLRSVADRRELVEGLASGRYDILLADISEMEALEDQVRMAPSKPFFLPVIYNPTGEELAAAEKQYSCVMRSPSKKQHYLAVIDDAMVLRQKQARVKK